MLSAGIKVKRAYHCFYAVMVMIMLTISQHSMAGLFDENPFARPGPLPVEEAFVFSSNQEGDQLTLSWQIPAEYYLYRDKIQISELSGVSVAEQGRTLAKEKDDPLFGKVWVYYDHGEVHYQLSNTTEKPILHELEVSYQGCWEGGICYPPQTQKVTINLPVAASSVTKLTAQASAADKATAQQAEPLLQQTLSVPVPPTDLAGLSEQDRFAALLKGDNLLLTLGAFFVAGLALSFTPCVFPMIPILSSIIAGQGRRVTTAKAFSLSVVYVLAVAITYTLAGIFAGLFGENLQALFQASWIIVLFSLIFVLLSLSMFGFYELQLPHVLQSRLTQLSNNQQGGTITGVAVMGLLSALIVGPCMAAPLAGALIYIGQTGDPVLGGLALFSLSLGMGVPLLLVGTSAGKLLPHAGAWMNQIKAVFGVLLLLMAVWMLDRVVPTVVTMWLTAIILIVSSYYMGLFSPSSRKTHHARRHLIRGLAMVVFLYGAALVIGALAGGKSMVYPLKGLVGTAAQAQPALKFNKVTTPEALAAELEKAKVANKVVMLDFYADWCVSCIELELYTFADSDVQRLLSAVHLVKVDVTANDEAAKQLNKQYSLIGPPALIFYNRSGEYLPNKTLIGVVEPAKFINHISGI